MILLITLSTTRS